MDQLRPRSTDRKSIDPNVVIDLTTFPFATSTLDSEEESPDNENNSAPHRFPHRSSRIPKPPGRYVC